MKGGQPLRRVAVLIEQMESPYIFQFVSELKRHAKDFNLQLIFYSGRTLGPTIRDFSGLYRIIGHNSIHGVIMLAGGLLENIDGDSIDSFLKMFHPLPVVTLDVCYENFSSVNPDNYRGMKELLDHLYQVHHYEKIDFITGPMHIDSAQLRYQAYIDFLEKYGLTFSEDQLFHGNFRSDSGIAAAPWALERIKRGTQVIVASNDDMALALIKKLKESDISVPEHVVITGFDNIEQLSIQEPPITTVELNFIEQSKQALLLLIEKMETPGKIVHTKVETQMVIRESCGCKRAEFLSSYLDSEELEDLDDYLSHYQQFLGHNRKLYADFAPQLLNEILNHFEVDQGSKSPLYQNFKAFIDQHCNSPFDIEGLFYLLSYIHHRIDSRREKTTDRIIESSAVLNRLRVILAQKSENLVSHHGVKINSLIWSSRDVLRNIVISNTYEELAEMTDESLHALGVESAQIIIGNILEERGNILLEFTPGGKEPGKVDQDFKNFPTEDFLSKTESPLVVMPLTYRDELLGVAAISLGEMVSIHFEYFRNQLSTSIKGIAIYKEQLKRLQELEHILNEEEKINAHLKQQLNELEETQQSLVETEKTAALGNLVAGVAHEINTPIGIGITSTSYLYNRVKEIIDGFEKSQLKKSELEDFFKKNREIPQMVTKNLEKASRQLSSFQLVAADQSHYDYRKIFLKDYIENIVQSLYHQWKRSGIKIEISGDKDLSIHTYPGVISQIITNILLNALRHGFPDEKSGRISIEFSSHEELVELRFTDDGVGIEEKLLTRIMDPFFTTRRQGGIGMGLYIVNALVRKTLKGELKIESTQGKGTTLSIKIPMKQAQGAVG